MENALDIVGNIENALEHRLGTLQMLVLFRNVCSISVKHSAALQMFRGEDVLQMLTISLSVARLQKYRELDESYVEIIIFQRKLTNVADMLQRCATTKKTF